jgi:hypothetical protein
MERFQPEGTAQAGPCRRKHTFCIPAEHLCKYTGRGFVDTGNRKLLRESLAKMKSRKTENNQV